MRFVRLSALIYLLLLSVRLVAVDVVGTEPGIPLHSIAPYRDIIEARMKPEMDEESTPSIDRDRIQADLIKRLDGDYPLDPTPLVARSTQNFDTARLEAPMPSAWCVIGHDAASIDWLKQYAPSFKSRRITGCFLIAAVDQSGFEVMQSITPVPLYRIQGKSLWQIQALSYYPIVLVGERYQGQGG